MQNNVIILNAKRRFIDRNIVRVKQMKSELHRLPGLLTSHFTDDTKTKINEISFFIELEDWFHKEWKNKEWFTGRMTMQMKAIVQGGLLYPDSYDSDLNCLLNHACANNDTKFLRAGNLAVMIAIAHSGSFLTIDVKKRKQFIAIAKDRYGRAIRKIFLKQQRNLLKKERWRMEMEMYYLFVLIKYLDEIVPAIIVSMHSYKYIKTRNKGECRCNIVRMGKLI